MRIRFLFLLLLPLCLARYALCTTTITGEEKEAFSKFLLKHLPMQDTLMNAIDIAERLSDPMIARAFNAFGVENPLLKAFASLLSRVLDGKKLGDAVYCAQASIHIPLLQKMTAIFIDSMSAPQEAGSFFVQETERKQTWLCYRRLPMGYVPFLFFFDPMTKGSHDLCLPPYKIIDHKIRIAESSNTEDPGLLYFTWDIERKKFDWSRGLLLSLIPSPSDRGKPFWNEHLIDRCGEEGYFARMPMAHWWLSGGVHIYAERDIPVSMYDKQNPISLLGDEYPVPPSKPASTASLPEWQKRNTQEFFIPLPSSLKDYEDVYDGVIRGLVEDYFAATVTDEKSQILQTLCTLGESYLLLENIPEEIPETRPEGVYTDAQWKKRQARLDAKGKKAPALEDVIRESQAEIAVARVRYASTTATAAVLDVPAVAAEEDPQARELRIMTEIEAANKAARDARVAERARKQREWEATHGEGGGGSGGASASAAGAGAGSGAGAVGTAMPESTSVDAPDRVIKWRHIVGYIKNQLKQAGIAAKLFESTGSSHFRLEATDPSTGRVAVDTVVRPHGEGAESFGSRYQELIGRILSRLGKDSDREGGASGGSGSGSRRK